MIVCYLSRLRLSRDQVRIYREELRVVIYGADVVRTFPLRNSSFVDRRRRRNVDVVHAQTYQCAVGGNDVPLRQSDDVAHDPLVRRYYLGEDFQL